MDRVRKMREREREREKERERERDTIDGCQYNIKQP